jgi:hypothetical protein
VEELLKKRNNFKLGFILECNPNLSISSFRITQHEIDYLEEGDGIINAFEFKWNPAAKYKIPKQFLENYQNSTFKVIDRENIEDFLLLDLK